jgi:hypothetical protein
MNRRMTIPLRCNGSPQLGSTEYQPSHAACYERRRQHFTFDLQADDKKENRVSPSLIHKNKGFETPKLLRLMVMWLCFCICCPHQQHRHTGPTHHAIGDATHQPTTEPRTSACADHD